jgi:hypothetical protein
MRTSTGFFFNLDVTQRESADANEGFEVNAIRASGKLESSPHKKIQKWKGGSSQLDLCIEQSLIYQWRYNTRSIYHLLRRTFGQCVAIAQVVDFNISDVIAVRNVHITIDRACAVACSW